MPRRLGKINRAETSGGASCGIAGRSLRPDWHGRPALLRCLHLCTDDPGSPAGETALGLVRALAQAGGGQGAPAVVQRAVAPEAWEGALAGWDVGLRTAPFRSFLDLTTRRRVADEMAVFRPDLIVLWGAEAARLVGRPKPGDKAVRLGALVAYEEPAAYAHAGARRLVAPTEDLAEFAREAGWPAGEVGTLAPVVPEPAVAPLLRQRWDTPENADLVAVTACDAPGLALVLDAWAQVHADVLLWLVPPPGPARRLKRRLRKAGLAERVKLVDDAALAAAGADLAVVARVDDPIGLPVVAAWAAERAVAALAAPGPAALIAHDRDGLLLAPDDPGLLARTVERLLRDPLHCDRLAAAGRAAYDRDYAPAHAADRWQLMLETLAGPPKATQRGEAGTDIRV